MRHKKSIIKSVLIIIVIIVLSVTATLAWTSYSGMAAGGSVNVGGLTYTVNGEMLDDETMINPHKELILEDITVNNQSSINSQLRLKIEYTIIEDGLTEQKIYQNAPDDDLVVHFDTDFTFDPLDNFWYYLDKASSLAASSGPTALINSMYYDGFSASNEYIGAPIYISILIQVKQTDNVTWEDLYNYDFSTGQPTT